jgi:hypothetical protein
MKELMIVKVISPKLFENNFVQNIGFS